MKLKCPKCNKIFTRDMRNKFTKTFMTKKGYKSYCEKSAKMVYCKPLKKNETN